MSAGGVGIGDVGALRALTQPIRLRILEVVADRTVSVRELAEQLDLARNKLHYHVNVLEEHGLLAVEDGDRGERRYRRTAHRFEAGTGRLPASVAAGITGILDDASRTLGAQLVSEREGPTAVGRLQVRLSADRKEDLIARIQSVMEEFDDAAAAPVTFVFAMYGERA